MKDNLGVPASPSGYQAKPEPKVSALRVGIPNAGQWAVCKAYRVPDVRKITKVTPTLVKFEGGRWPRQKHKSEVITCVDDEQTALLLAQSLAGAAGQREKRIMKAREDFDQRKASAWAEYERTEARLVASAIEARGVETEGLHAKHESAVAESIAQTTVSSSKTPSPKGGR